MHIKIGNNGEPFTKLCPQCIFFFLDDTSVSISSDQYDTTYYIEEDAEIKAHFENSLAVRTVKWKRETDTGSHDINTTLPKYRGTINNTSEQQHVLKIRSCDKSDAGTYFLQVSCADREIRSNKIHLQVLKGNAIKVSVIFRSFITRESILLIALEYLPVILTFKIKTMVFV